MGYTHFFKDLQPTQNLADLTEEIIIKSGIIICGGDGIGKPEISPTCISLNGCRAKHESFETFRIQAESKGFNFCKTGRRPYDTVVTAVLTAAIFLQCPGWEHISSDGAYKDWKPGIRLFEQASGFQFTDHHFLISAMLETDSFLWHRDEDGLLERNDARLLEIGTICMY